MRRKNWAIPGLLALTVLLLLSFPGVSLADDSNTVTAQEAELLPVQQTDAQEAGGETNSQQGMESAASDAKVESASAAEPEEPVSEDSGKAEDQPAAEPEKPVSEDLGTAEDTPAAEPEEPVSEDSGKAEEPSAEPGKPAFKDTVKAGDKTSDSDASDNEDNELDPAEQDSPKPAPILVVPKSPMDKQEDSGSVIVVRDPETGQVLPGYVVQPGDNLETISKKTRVPLDDLKKANGLNVDEDEVAMPMPQTSSVLTDVSSTGGNQEEKATGPHINYKVRKGESLWLIGRSMGIPYEDIMAANKLTDYLIYPDQELIIPGIMLEGGMFRYRIKAGDTFYLIARALGLDYNDIMSLNGFDDIWIYPGEKLVIPDLNEVDLYRVQEGDTLSDIAGKFRVIEKQIYGHGISNGLVEGQALVIPQDRAVNVNVQVLLNNTDLVDAGELELLARAIHGEARGEVYEGQVAVAAVILNRLKDPAFPKTIKDIIFQPRAFTAVDDGQINLTPDAEAYRAAREAMNGADPTLGAVYYWNPEIATSKWIWTRPIIKQIGNHVFAR